VLVVSMTPVMYSDISGEFPILITLIIVGSLVGGSSQYLANTLNGKEGSDRWEGVIGASIGGAIALPMIIVSTPIAAVGLALTSGFINGTVNEVERSIKYGTNFSLGSALYDSCIYSGLNMIPITKYPGIASGLTLGIDTIGFTLADRYKDNSINRIDNSVYNFRQDLNKTTYEIYNAFIQSVTGGRGNLYPFTP